MFNQFMYYESNDYDYYLIYVKLENGTRIDLPRIAIGTKSPSSSTTTKNSPCIMFFTNNSFIYGHFILESSEKIPESLSTFLSDYSID
ncbi:hypothetical protein DERF_000761 [Dermatophagoides farinae]|uniref:Uncharacterized protein n=1 Tax=Dermatophagoides farinae TaxID=6954 RepID=A0A922I831_DERFA|nr:hypothetical protein DERF_000761 [Dermatophagoides farinae]